ncbi:MAG TPA: MFS transporter [Spirillospora sp.]|nr:MFS transporter [Spirillospora sp.]
MTDKAVALKQVNLTSMTVIFLFGRLVINMTRRFSYPFIPAIAQRLGTSIGSVQSALALSWGVGIFSPVFGVLTERFGRKPVMLGALALMALVSLLGVFVPQFWAFAFVVVMYGISKMIFDPALQAYVGDRVPFAQRARTWGAIELSWSGSLFVIAPLTGLLLEQAGLQPVFAVLFVLLCLAMALIWLFIPDDRPDQPAASPVKSQRQPVLRLLRQRPLAFAALGYSFCMIAAQEIFFINYALWMEISFELVLATMGLATVVLGLAEAVGEVAVSAFGDRFGLQRMTLYGTVLSAAGFALIPHLNQSLPLALAAMFVLFVLVEISIVASIGLFTEVLAEARAVMMSANFSAMSLGRLAGALFGGGLYALTQSFGLIGVVTMVFVLVGGGFIWLLGRRS